MVNATGSRTRASLKDLPLELIQTIISHACSKVTSREICWIALVSQFFCHASTPLLYASVTFNSPKQAVSFTRYSANHLHKTVVLSIRFWVDTDGLTLLVGKLLASFRKGELKHLTIGSQSRYREAFPESLINHPNLSDLSTLTVNDLVQLRAERLNFKLDSLCFDELAFWHLHPFAYRAVVASGTQLAHPLRRLDLGGISLSRYEDNAPLEKELKDFLPLIAVVQELVFPSLNSYEEALPPPFYEFLKAAKSLVHFTLPFNKPFAYPSIHHHTLRSIKALDQSLSSLIIRIDKNPHLRLNTKLIALLHECLDTPASKELTVLEIRGLALLVEEEVEGKMEFAETCKLLGIKLAGF